MTVEYRTDDGTIRGAQAQILDLISNIKVGDEAARSKDVLGRVYKYFLSRFASAEGKKGGEFYTPRSVVKLLVEMLEPCRGRVYDPCCGSSGMFVQSVEFIDAHTTGSGSGGRIPRGAKTTISIYGQESNYTTWRIAKDAGLTIGELLSSDASRMALQRHRLTQKIDNNGQEKPQRTRHLHQVHHACPAKGWLGRDGANPRGGRLYQGTHHRAGQAGQPGQVLART